jgi:hypothetical protein
MTDDIASPETLLARGGSLARQGSDEEALACFESLVRCGEGIDRRIFATALRGKAR